MASAVSAVGLALLLLAAVSGLATANEAEQMMRQPYQGQTYESYKHYVSSRMHADSESAVALQLRKRNHLAAPTAVVSACVCAAQEAWGPHPLL
jgi:hypothetical protein